MVKFAMLVMIEAKPNKVAEVEKFLQYALSIVQNEQDNIAWFAVRFGPTTFGVFDAFTTEEGREGHLNGVAAKTLFAKASEILAKPPEIKKVDVLEFMLPK
jgi:quinol monooxygenase YgiN